MSARSIETGRIAWFTGCALSGEQVRAETAAAVVVRMGGVCPVHRDTACLETYFAESELASRSLLGLLRLRRRWRRQGRGR